MKALLIKDFKTIKLYFVLIAVFGFLLSFGDTVPYLGFVYVLLIPMVLMNQDELTHFNRLSSMMPISSSEAVCEKYVITLIGLAVALVFSALGILVSGTLVSGDFGFDKLILGTCVVLLYCAITMPLDFLASSQVGRSVLLVLSMLVLGVAAGIFFAAIDGEEPLALGGTLAQGVRIGAVAVSLALFGASIPLSILIYKRKDK